ncbi:hypothetical protein DV735_g5290, partial [Chaetothyriales sp. CBS 134920]
MATIFSPIEANASVYQLDHRQLNEIVMPDLQDMAGNPALLEHLRDRRFNGDDPPSYRSRLPNDDDENNDINENNDEATSVQGWMLADHQTSDEIDELVSRPLSEEELHETQRHFESWHPAYHPGLRYEKEAMRDAMFDMMKDPGLRDPQIRNQFDGRAGEQRQKVVIRHRIKKRWERLGVWNPEWGIPGRVDEAPRDKTSSWKWRWQADTPTCGNQPSAYLPEHPNSRAIHLREGLRRGERGPLPPRHSLGVDVSRSVAEAFITSRPWYIYGLDEEEERTRLDRIPRIEQRFNDMDHEAHVSARWRERGDWAPFGKAIGWKWKHESPSPEPEGLSNMDFTPSEIDALEAIPPPTPQPPPSPCRRWEIVPGTEHMVIPEFREVFSPEPEASADISKLDEETDASSPPPQKPRRGRPRGGNAKSAPRPEPESSGTPELRRSTRVASTTEAAEQLGTKRPAAKDGATHGFQTARRRKEEGATAKDGRLNGFSTTGHTEEEGATTKDGAIHSAIHGISATRHSKEEGAAAKNSGIHSL